MKLAARQAQVVTGRISRADSRPRIMASGAASAPIVFLPRGALRAADIALPEEASRLFNCKRKGNELNEVLKQISTLSHRQSLSETDWESLRHLVGHAVQRMGEQADADAQLRQLALTDELTGLYNRRGFLVLAMHQLKLCRRNAQKAMLFFADVDGLKQVNDAYGHASGDDLLMRCSGALRATFRESDIVARLDGDEFAVLALEQKLQSEESAVARLRRNVEEQNAGSATEYALSVSVGATRFDPRSPCSLAELLMAADGAMYREKKSRPDHRANCTAQEVFASE